MRIQKNKLICLMLILLVFFSGMYFETFEIHSSFSCTREAENSAESLSYAVVLTEGQMCTTEMLEAHRGVGFQQLVYRFVNQKREAKYILSFLCSDVFSLSEEEFFKSSGYIQCIQDTQEELVTRYIQKTDGKKRM